LLPPAIEVVGGEGGQRAVGGARGARHWRSGRKSRAGGGRGGEVSVTVTGGRSQDNDAEKKGEGVAHSPYRMTSRAIGGP
jgi:hypothetical protein